MSKFAEARQNMLDEAREQAEKLTKRRLEDDGVDFHAEKENYVNTTEGVTESTPVSQARVANPAEPDWAPAGIKAEEVSKSNQTPESERVVNTLKPEAKGKK